MIFALSDCVQLSAREATDSSLYPPAGNARIKHAIGKEARRSMPDELHVDEAAGIIKVRSYGVVSRDDIAASMDQIRKIIEEKGIHKVLVDTLDQQAMPGTIDVFHLFSTLPQSLRAAIVVRADQGTAKSQKFAETVSQNRGINVRVFHATDEALRWLNEV